MRDADILSENLPPPLPTDYLNNRWAWLLTFVPLIGAIIEAAVYGSTGTPFGQSALVYIIANSIVSSLDSQNISKSGYNVKRIDRFWGTILVPVYLFRRARLLRQKQTLFWMWFASIALGAIVSSLANS